MNKLETVSSWQLAILFIAFTTGSAIIYVPDSLLNAAKNGAWISIILASAISFFLLTVTLYLHRKYPGMTWIDYSRKTVGSVLTVLLSIPFLTMVLLMLCLIIIGLGGFFTSTMMRQTPPYMFHLFTLLVAALTVRAGIEAMARMFTLLLFSMYVTVIVVFLFSIPYYRPELLLPVMPEGIKPVLHGSYILVFPYGEVILFSMLLPFVKKEKKPRIRKLMFSALLLNTLTLLTVVICTVMALGPVAGERVYSLFQMARLIEIADIIERIESVIGIQLTLGTYMKATIALFILNLGVTRLFKLDDDRVLVLPLAFLSFLLTLVMFRNEAEYVKMVQVNWPLVVIVCGVVPVMFIALASLFRRKGSAGR